MEKANLSVLVIEDDLEDYILLRTYLSRATRSHFELTHVQHFQEAVKCLVEHQFDVILADYFLDGHTATDLFKHVKLIGVDTPIVVLTGMAATELDDVLMQLGASDFIPKDELTTALLERSIRHAIERKRAEQQISQLIKRDPLTGLGNRLIFEEHAELAIARAKRNKSRLAVAFLDLDRFKNVNDTLGHHVGDLLLTLVGKRIQDAIRASDFVARIGGDEFTLLLDNVQDVESLNAIANKVLSEVTRHAILDCKHLEVSASMGIALYPDQGETVSELMRKADMALYESKKQEGSCHHMVFSDSLQARLQKETRVENGLQQALANDEFVLYYQPIVSLDTHRIKGVEALIRWRQPDGKLLLPGEFIEEVNRVGLIGALGEWVLEAACKQLRAWLDMRVELTMSINISPRHLRQTGFDELVINTVRRYQIPEGYLMLELTEEVFVDSGISSLYVLNEIRRVGVRIAIDDFGTGYSSMRYLKSLPIDRIKIDRCFVSGSGDEQLSDPMITQAIGFLAEGLGLDLVAEGIETAEQAAALSAQGCHNGQGFLFAKPQSSEHLLALVEQQQALSVSG
ncbi:GGDEF domain-containing response regulator [Marinomonas ostreistagni]|uniref:GGDEF domain-containing response regulator n=1 Tax=Marinomonas ostreistagni TaxID=359209 RepID=A0ABS0ZD52_9GAMM|nr:GGDEF domain-containing response regulator [Marinomonas ostreistagni]MBJ7551123.1 GGDEF domain-containing response regulator [Marinomonas ostreistagni]